MHGRIPQHTEYLFNNVRRQDARRGGGMRRWKRCEQGWVLIVMHGGGRVHMRALLGAAIPVRVVWGLVPSRVRGRPCGGGRGMAGRVLRRRELGVRGRVLERMPGGVRVHMRIEQGRLRDHMRGRTSRRVRGVRRRQRGRRGRMQLDMRGRNRMDVLDGGMRSVCMRRWGLSSRVLWIRLCTV
jgi:hypothetical protein